MLCPSGKSSIAKCQHEASRLMKELCLITGINNQEFIKNLSKYLDRDCETVRRYMYHFPRKYILSEFGWFKTAIIQSISRCVNSESVQKTDAESAMQRWEKYGAAWLKRFQAVHESAISSNAAGIQHDWEQLMDSLD